MTLSIELAKFVKQTESVPASTQRIVVHAVFDLLTAAIVGLESAGGRSGSQAAGTLWGSGPSTCWFTSDKLMPAGAAFANSTIASMLDLDDGHRAAAGHPGASIIPAVLAMEAQNHGNTERVMTAIALGYEIAIRLAASRDIEKLDTLVSGRWCAQGVTAAIGWLKNLSTIEIAQGISIAATCAPNLDAIAYSGVMGCHVKEGIPWGTVTGIAAADLAAAGSTGPIDFLDNPSRFNPDIITGGLGKSWLIEGIYFKPYSCCRWAHAPIDALLAIQADEDIKADEIQSIRVKTFSRTLKLNNEHAPKNLEAAQYSVPYCLALAAYCGSTALLPLRESLLEDARVIDLASRVSLEVDPQLDALFPKLVPGEVEIVTGKNKYSRRVMEPKGEVANPMAWSDLEVKFEQATEGLISHKLGSQIKEAITAFENFDIVPLRNVLSKPAL